MSFNHVSSDKCINGWATTYFTVTSLKTLLPHHQINRFYSRKDHPVSEVIDLPCTPPPRELNNTDHLAKVGWRSNLNNFGLRGVILFTIVESNDAKSRGGSSPALFKNGSSKKRSSVQYALFTVTYDPLISSISKLQLSILRPFIKSNRTWP